MSITVLAPGMLTTVQDAGRSGHAALGVGCAGAMDEVALRLANILVDNAQDAAGLEITLRGPRLRFERQTLVAITGAEIDARCEGVALAAWRPLVLTAGSELILGAMPSGARSYLAVAGGINAAAMLGSRSTDVNARLGGRVLASGYVLTLGEPRRMRHPQHRDAAAAWSLDSRAWFDPDLRKPIRIVTGTHYPHLDSASQRALLAASFRIDADSNRVGYRLRGATLTMTDSVELISAGVVPGTLQLPPGGDPIVLMAEAPTSGGYPRIAQTIAVDLPRLAQRRPGDTVHFVATSLEDAQTRYLERERALARIARSVAERLHD